MAAKGERARETARAWRERRLDDRTRASVDQLLRSLLLQAWRAFGPGLGWDAVPAEDGDERLDGPAAYLADDRALVEVLRKRVLRHAAADRLRGWAAAEARHAAAMMRVDIVDELAGDADPLLAEAAVDLLAEEAAGIDGWGRPSLLLADLAHAAREAVVHALAAWRRLDLSPELRPAHDRALLGSTPADGENRRPIAAEQLAGRLVELGRATPSLALDALGDGHVMLFEALAARLMDLPSTWRWMPAGADALLAAAVCVDRGERARLLVLLARAADDDEDRVAVAVAAALDEAANLGADARARLLLRDASPSYRDAVAAAGDGPVT